ncbi:Serine/Threonine kinase domain protein (macronuclear) [Tetrahymena thermophila SB210]|uniref:Serine/Threonine kinase domain protein n=1 Tax=Tetrahymena thermophila (strain SB210) TaxID=312017 RepID=Q24GE7_TETTS|nr:Serine/Threonine kinase domain protein [Tetrahymena thermophila SB210]EAS06924.1 Serine/Threonine kinase domain protein [Tetrahymena thermophila SB210]|eukprot:XP_001027166.1 Serine/Threonine kinase domain protein [Tetrahymena thermophila SB210]
MADNKIQQQKYDTDYTQIRAQSYAPFQVTNLHLDDGQTNIPNDEIERSEENEKKFQDYLEKQQQHDDPREALLKQYSKEDRPYKIVDLNNNCVYDARVEEDILKLTTINSMKSPSTIKNNKPTWQDFWKNVKKCNIDLLDAAEIGNVDKIKYLLDKSKNLYPVDLNYQSLDNYTALHFSVTDMHNQIVQILIDNGCNIEAETTFKRRPLHLCCIIGNIDALKILIKHKAEINPLDNNNNTPILLASQNRWHEIVEILLDNGGDPHIKNNKGENAVNVCDTQNMYDVFMKHKIYETEGFVLKDNFSNFNKKQNGQNQNEGGQVEEGKVEENNSEQGQRVSSPEKIRNLINKEGIIEMQKKTVQDYEYYRILGSGAFGKVILVKDKKNQKYYAMKIISKEKFQQLNLMKYALSEKNAMSKMQHPFIVKLHYAFQTKRKLFLIQQYCGGGSLGRMLKIKQRFDEQTAKKYMCQIILAIEALHDNLIIFRDLKPDNIVLDEEGNAYLVDFGLAKLGVYDEINKSFLGTPAYLPPEIIVKDGHNRMADWYAVGIVLYELLMGCTPFNQGNVSREVLYERIKQNSIKIPSNISSECQDIIQKLLCKNPKKRLGYKNDGKEIRSHPWFEGIDWEKVIQKKIPMPKPVIRTIPNEPLDVRFNEECDKQIDVQNWTEIND